MLLTRPKKQTSQFAEQEIKVPPYILIQKEGSQAPPTILNSLTPWSLTLRNMAYRDLHSALGSAFRPKEREVHSVSEWVYRYTLAVSRATGEVSRLDFGQYPWQLQILNDPSHRVCVQKSTQIGISEICLRKGLWFIMKHPGTTLMYCLPNEELSNNFADMRLETVLEKSPRLVGAVGSTDSYGRKNIGDSWIVIKSSYSKASAQSTPVDILVVDEEDFSMPGIRTSLNERLSSSPHDFTIDISIPLRKDSGIHRLWSQSTRNRWMVVCRHCSGIHTSLREVDDLWAFQQWLQRQDLLGRQYLTLDHIHPSEEDGLFEYHCERCGGILDRELAHWEFSLEEVQQKTKGGRPEFWSGYKTSQLAAPYISATAIMGKMEDYHQGLFMGNEGDADFGSQVTAEPPEVSSADLRPPSEHDVRQLFLSYEALSHDLSGQCSMGIDWGQKEAWGVISRPMDFEGAETYRVLVALIKVVGDDPMDHARELLTFAERFSVGAVFADFGYGAPQNRALARGLAHKVYPKFWEVVSSNPTFKQIQSSPKKVYQTRFDTTAQQVHVMANTVMRRHIWAILNRGFYVMRPPDLLRRYWMEHHSKIVVEKIQIPGSDLSIIGFGKSGPDHLARAACYDLLAYEYLRLVEKALGDTQITAEQLQVTVHAKDRQAASSRRGEKREAEYVASSW